MNKEMMKRNVGTHVRLVPEVCRLDINGFKLRAVDDDWWFIQSVSDEGVTITDQRNGYVKVLGYDHIHKFTSDESRGGARRGFLSLHVQLFVQGNEVRILPNARPGEAVEPRVPNIVEKIVPISYPSESGMQSRLEAQGYLLGWARPENVSHRVDLEGYEVVLEADGSGAFGTFRTRDGLVLLKRHAGPKVVR